MSEYNPLDIFGKILIINHMIAFIDMNPIHDCFHGKSGIVQIFKRDFNTYVSSSEIIFGISILRIQPYHYVWNFCLDFIIY